MSDIKLTYDETPLAWPASVQVADLKTCSTCGIRVLAPQPGSLQCLTRRLAGGDGKGTRDGQGAGGDGVTIDEFIGIGADYRGQRYTFEEAVFHTPGLHKFPDQASPYPAEYHIHMRTMSAPIRYITIVLPLSHTVSGSESTKYFAAISATPDPAARRPTLETLFQGSHDVIQYQGPDIRGRTADQPIPTDQKSEERQFLLVLNVGHIRATDLERIPREGSASTDPRDLPAPGVQPKKTMLRDHLLRSSILASPGILHGTKATVAQSKAPMEVECKPIKVVNGRDVIEKFDGKIVDVKKLLGLDEEKESGPGPSQQATVIRTTSFAISMILGIILADVFAEKFWSLFFIDSDRLHKMSWMKIVFYIIIISSLIAIF